MSTDRTIELHLLGGFALIRDGRPIGLPRSAQRTLVLLALRGACPRAWVASTLWPDASDRQALASVRTTIWRVQRTGVTLAVPGSDVLKLPTEIRIDIHEPQRAALAARPIPTLLPGWS